MRRVRGCEQNRGSYPYAAGDGMTGCETPQTAEKEEVYCSRDSLPVQLWGLLVNSAVDPGARAKRRRGIEVCEGELSQLDCRRKRGQEAVC